MSSMRELGHHSSEVITAVMRTQFKIAHLDLRMLHDLKIVRVEVNGMGCCIGHVHKLNAAGLLLEHLWGITGVRRA